MHVKMHLCLEALSKTTIFEFIMVHVIHVIHGEDHFGQKPNRFVRNWNLKLINLHVRLNLIRFRTHQGLLRNNYLKP